MGSCTSAREYEVETQQSPDPVETLCRLIEIDTANRKREVADKKRDATRKKRGIAIDLNILKKRLTKLDHLLQYSFGKKTKDLIKDLENQTRIFLFSYVEDPLSLESMNMDELHVKLKDIITKYESELMGLENIITEYESELMRLEDKVA